jgi:hypothetical protein
MKKFKRVLAAVITGIVGIYCMMWLLAFGLPGLVKPMAPALRALAENFWTIPVAAVIMLFAILIPFAFLVAFVILLDSVLCKLFRVDAYNLG